VTESLPLLHGLLDLVDPAPAVNEQEIMAKRLARLTGGLAGSAEQVTKLIRRRRNEFGGLADQFVLRPKFMYQSEPATIGSEWSDRKLPPREDRPSATRIMSGRGAALRFYLTALADAQIRTKAGKRPDNPIPIRSDVEGETAWTDLLASSSVAASQVLDISVRDKKERQLHTALKTLRKAELVQLPNPPGAKDRYARFVLLNEVGARRESDPLPYAVPRASEAIVRLPAEFITKGWVHLLEDSEIATLLMVACGYGNVSNDSSIAIPGATRVQHYGLGRDAYEAHRMLRRLGLVRVESIGRWVDGSHVEDYGDEQPMLHRITLLPKGFAGDPAGAIKKALEEQLRRTPRPALAR